MAIIKQVEQHYGYALSNRIEIPDAKGRYRTLQLGIKMSYYSVCSHNTVSGDPDLYTFELYSQVSSSTVPNISFKLFTNSTFDEDLVLSGVGGKIIFTFDGAIDYIFNNIDLSVSEDGWYTIVSNPRQILTILTSENTLKRCKVSFSDFKVTDTISEHLNSFVFPEDYAVNGNYPLSLISYGYTIPSDSLDLTDESDYFGAEPGSISVNVDHDSNLPLLSYTYEITQGSTVIASGENDFPIVNHNISATDLIPNTHYYVSVHAVAFNNDHMNQLFDSIGVETSAARAPSNLEVTPEVIYKPELPDSSGKMRVKFKIRVNTGGLPVTNTNSALFVYFGRTSSVGAGTAGFPVCINYGTWTYSRNYAYYEFQLFKYKIDPTSGTSADNLQVLEENVNYRWTINITTDGGNISTNGTIKPVTKYLKLSSDGGSSRSYRGFACVDNVWYLLSPDSMFVINTIPKVNIFYNIGDILYSFPTDTSACPIKFYGGSDVSNITILEFKKGTVTYSYTYTHTNTYVDSMPVEVENVIYNTYDSDTAITTSEPIWEYESVMGIGDILTNVTSTSLNLDGVQCLVSNLMYYEVLLRINIFGEQD